MKRLFIKIKKQEIISPKYKNGCYGLTKFGHALIIKPNKDFTEAEVINSWGDDLLDDCNHESTGKWMVEDGKSFAECKKCGKWYQTTLIITGK